MTSVLRTRTLLLLMAEAAAPQHRWAGQAALLRAVRAGDAATLARLLDSDLGLDPDTSFALGGGPRPAVCLAVEEVSSCEVRSVQRCVQGHLAVLEELCRRRCSLAVRDQAGLCPLHLAASLGRPRLVAALLRHRADLAAVTRDQEGLTALHLATRHQHADTVRLLLERGAEVNTQVQPQPHFAAPQTAK